MNLDKFSEPVREAMRTEFGRDRHAQPAGRRAPLVTDHPLRIRDLIEHADTAVEVRLSYLGGIQFACRALHELNTQLLFDFCYSPAAGRLRDIEFQSGFGDASVSQRFDEKPHIGKFNAHPFLLSTAVPIMTRIQIMNLRRWLIQPETRYLKSI
jgi:hypothetical protein